MNGTEMNGDAGIEIILWEPLVLAHYSADGAGTLHVDVHRIVPDIPLLPATLGRIIRDALGHD